MMAFFKLYMQTTITKSHLSRWGWIHGTDGIMSKTKPLNSKSFSIYMKTYRWL